MMNINDLIRLKVGQFNKPFDITDVKQKKLSACIISKIVDINNAETDYLVDVLECGSLPDSPRQVAYIDDIEQNIRDVEVLLDELLAVINA